MSPFAVLMILFALVCILDIGIAVASFRRGKEKGISLGFTCLGSFLATVCYLLSLYVRDLSGYSILSSIYFFGIDFTLVSLLAFTWQYTMGADAPKGAWLFRVMSLYMIVDGIVLAINPFNDIAVTYVYHEAELACYSYQMHPLYYVHLIYTYALVAIILFFLVRKVVDAPIIYGKQYLYCVLTIVAVVGINAVYLFLPGLFGENIDYSLLGYSIGAFFFYWNCFNYSSHGLLVNFHTWIFENINQALVLFDFDDKLIMSNRKAEGMLPQGLLQEEMHLTDFLSGCGIRPGHETRGQHYTFQCFINGHPLRCDYSVQLDKKQRRLGRLFAFSDVSTQFDMLTGFRNWTDFKENAAALFPDADEKLVVATCDINSLADINLKYGRVNGDRAIQCLAETMRAVFPSGTEFTRAREASVAAICRNVTVDAVDGYIRLIQKRLMENDILDVPIQIQSSVSARGQESIEDTIRRNLQSMRTKKLMDKSSVHSEMLRSLLQALTQCDPDTSAHVQRTQRSGQELGRRIGLTDQQQSQLALLAILHDIGKIGIPLEILNKPGKLTEAEWKMLKTHTEKGYQIAKSSHELSEIAEMILYHHERWDGRGYPAGLKEEQIPLLSRVIAVVDAYDAMTNDRAYRKALSESAARSELKRCAGTQFDPTIVSEFLKMLESNDQKQGIIVSTMSVQEQTAAQEQPVPAQREHRNVHAMAYSMYVISQSRIIEVDDRFETLTGYTREDIQNQNVSQMDLIFEEDRNEYIANLVEKSALGTDIYLEHRLRRKNGEAIYVYCYGHQFYSSAEGEERTRIVIINSDDPFGEQ